MQRLIIADSHLGQRAEDAQQMRTLLLGVLSAGIGEVIYLGDAFQYLIGPSKLWTSTVVEILQVWQRCRKQGLRVVLVEGNRDFFLDEPELAGYLDWSGRIYEFTAGHRRYRLAHGDMVNQRDFQYRFWSAVSKSSPARLLANLLPRLVAVAIVRRMEARLARTNRRFRKRKPERALRRQADQAWASGVDVVLWGHFHSLWEYRQGDRQAMVVPAWLTSRASLLVDANGTWSFVGLGLTPLESAPTMLAT